MKDLKSGKHIKNVVALAGGVGGARLADGLARAIADWPDPGKLTIIVNVGDDFEHLGLQISPDLDTVCYTLAGLGNQETGWGLANESFSVFSAIEMLGGPSWFKLGDRDLATHLVRTGRLKSGESLSQITADFCKLWGVTSVVLPVSDDRVSTVIYTENGSLPFQEYFVHQHCEPVVQGFRFVGVSKAWPAPGVLEAIEEADVLVICPSNPWVSIDPILAVPGVQETILRRRNDGMPVIAVSPIIGGKAVKGPAAKIFSELGIDPTAIAVAHHYGSLLSGFVLDLEDLELVEKLQLESQIPEPDGGFGVGLPVIAVNTLMRNEEVRCSLGQEVLNLAENQIRQKLERR